MGGPGDEPRNQYRFRRQIFRDLSNRGNLTSVRCEPGLNRRKKNRVSAGYSEQINERVRMHIYQLLLIRQIL